MAEGGQVAYLSKEGLANLWGKIKTKFLADPSGGIEGQVLIKTENGYNWGNISADLPDVIPVSQGGTGCTTVDGIRTLLFNFPTDSELDTYIDLSSLGE